MEIVDHGVEGMHREPRLILANSVLGANFTCGMDEVPVVAERLVDKRRVSRAEDTEMRRRVNERL